jgi:hypothetical protein
MSTILRLEARSGVGQPGKDEAAATDEVRCLHDTLAGLRFRHAGAIIAALERERAAGLMS